MSEIPNSTTLSNQAKGKGKGGNRNRNRGKGGRGGNNNGGAKKKNQISQKQPTGITETCTFVPTKPDPEPQIMDDDAPDHHNCLICYSSHLHQERGITPCGHDDVCASCHLRLRSLLSDKKCPICKTSNEQIIVDTDPDPEVNEHKSFNQYEKWGDDIGPNYTYREDVGMFFPVSYYNIKVVPIFALSCNVKSCAFANDSSESSSPGTLKALKNHLATQHNPPLQICELCITHKRDFISRLPRFTAAQLKDHNKYGDMGRNNVGSAAGKANKGHPMCQFCQPKRFYDLTELHKHLNKEHYECFVCKKLDKPLQFFKDYNKLNLHFDREHFLCRFPECLAARFVVFSNEIDLKAHERDMHGLVTGGSTKIQMEFRVRSSGRDGSGVLPQQQQAPNMEEDFGYGLDGEVFVPESLDDNTNLTESQHNEPEITHGPHAERTALLREQARLRREQLGMVGENAGEVTEEAFPTLGNQGAGTMASWSREGGSSSVSIIRGRKTTALNEENFPSLGGPTGTKVNNKVSKLRATGGASSQFAAMSLAANSSTSTSRPFANATGTQQSFFASAASSRNAMPTLSANNFPSLGGGRSRPTLSTNNFPSLGGGSRPSMSAGNFPSLGGGAPPNMGSDNFPSLGGGNKYAAAQAYAKKNINSKGINLNMDQHFPAPATSIASKKKNVFDKKPAAKLQTDNILAFPPPPSARPTVGDGANQVEGMKQALGQAKYKKLKKNTKEFASNALDPESYVSTIISLFDDGIKDPSLWEFIPGLISSCPNESKNKRALRYLENMRFSSGETAPKISSSISNERVTAPGGWASTASSSISSVVASTLSSMPIQYGSAASRAAAFAPSRQTISTGYTGRSLPVPQVKQKNSWASGSKITSKPGAGNSLLAAAASQGPQNGTATKFMAKEKAEERKARQKESLAKQGENAKKKKAKVKKNELRELAFGKF